MRSLARADTSASRALAASAAATLLALALVGCGQRQRLSITVAGRREQVAAGTTLAQAASHFRLRPPAGNLLDVQGHVFRHGVFSGSLLLDGRRVPGATRLRTGSRVTLTPGRDRTEPLRRQIVPVPPGSPSDPQFLLARTPGVEVIVRGALSHQLVSARFRPDRRQPTVERAVALTFDDGPSPANTPRILALLHRLHVRATFFVIGYLADQYPGLIRQELQAGMTLGNHSYNHPQVPPFDQLPPRLLADEILLGAQSLRRAGVDPLLFRPPGGSFSPAVVRATEKIGERIVLWSVDPRDWQPGTTARQIARAVLAAVRPGSIIELHDGGGDRTATLAALPTIVRGIRLKHLRLVEIPVR